MLSNKVKAIGFTVAILGLVACGKNNNKINTDGTFETEETVQQNGKDVKLVNVIENKDGVSTTYRFSADKKYVEVKKEQLQIKGDRILGRTVIEDKCNSANVGQLESDNTRVLKNGKSLTVATNGQQLELKAVSEDLKERVEALKAKTPTSKGDIPLEACLDENGNLSHFPEEVKSEEADAAQSEDAAVATEEQTKTEEKASAQAEADAAAEAKSEVDQAKDAAKENVKEATDAASDKVEKAVEGAKEEEKKSDSSTKAVSPNASKTITPKTSNAIGLGGSRFDRTSHK